VNRSEAELERVRGRLAEVMGALAEGRLGGATELDITVGNLVVLSLSDEGVASLCRQLGIPQRSPMPDSSLRRIGRLALEQAGHQTVIDELDRSWTEATRREARAFQELRPDVDPDIPPATPDQLADDTLLSETQVEARDLSLPDEALQDPRPFDEWLAETAAVLERNARIFKNRDDEEER
jgi:hypothetical protein